METQHFLVMGLSALFSFCVLQKVKRHSACLHHSIPQESARDFQELLSLLEESSEDWELLKDLPNITLHKKQTGHSPFAIIRARILIPGTSTKCVFQCIWDEKTRKSWDRVIQDFHVLERLSGDSELIYFYVKSPMPFVANREFVQRRSYSKTADSYVTVYRSVTKEELPVPEGWVRAHTVISGYHIYPVHNAVAVEFISQNDLRGQLPPKLINSFAPAKALEWVKALARASQSLTPP